MMDIGGNCAHPHVMHQSDQNATKKIDCCKIFPQTVSQKTKNIQIDVNSKHFQPFLLWKRLRKIKNDSNRLRLTIFWNGWQKEIRMYKTKLISRCLKNLKHSKTFSLFWFERILDCAKLFKNVRDRLRYAIFWNGWQSNNNVKNHGRRKV